MSNQDLIIEERSRDIGNFLVGRLIPFRKKRMVGPFIFIDHMGPSQVGPEKYMDIDRHPHIGLSTLTYLFEGTIEHRDSIGTQQVIRPGAVNWMTAGKGVTHTERTPEDLRNGAIQFVHGFQIWVALPDGKEEIEPSFYHIDGEELPKWEDDDASYTLIAGEGYGKRSPVPVYSNLFMVEIKAKEDFEFNNNGYLEGEIGITIVDGSVETNGETINKGNMLVSKDHSTCNIVIKKGSHLLLFGGEPFENERHISWNFVSSSRDRIKQAEDDWTNDRFPKIDGDDSYVPLP